MRAADVSDAAVPERKLHGLGVTQGIAIAPLHWLPVSVFLSDTVDTPDQEAEKLRAAVAEQRALNESLRHRNAALDAEVVNLKRGRDAAEERARTDLGLIGKDETFYQVVPIAESRR